VVNETPLPGGRLAGYLAQAFPEHDETFVVIDVSPQAGAVHQESIASDVTLVTAPLAQAASVPQWEAWLAGYDHVLVTGPGDVRAHLPEAVVASFSGEIVYFVDDIARAFPYQHSPLAIVHHVLVGETAGLERGQGFRRGGVRITIDEDDVGDPRLAHLPRRVREGFERLGRVVTRCTVGLALGGGGAWGFAHIALIHALHEIGVPVDMIAGTSMGGIVGGAYAHSGLQGIDHLAMRGSELGTALAAGLITSNPLRQFLESLLGEVELEDLPIPFFCVATDIDRATEKVFRHGRLSDAVRASSAFPGNSPAVIDGRRYVDGGVVNNVPSNVLAEEGADFIIAAPVMQNPEPRDDANQCAPLGVFALQASISLRLQDIVRSMYMLLRFAGVQQAETADVSFAPNLSRFSTMDFKAAPDIIDEAREQIESQKQVIENRYRGLCRTHSAGVDE